ncbi:MAG: flagellar hook-basal body complex protein FliE [Cyanobacteria bacterium]|nr:flagellar hook-basal body complex protein FliE [Cyanobacteriota bacterium]
MNEGYVPKLSMGPRLEGFSGGLSGGMSAIGAVSQNVFASPASQGASFKEVMMNSIGQVDQVLQKPDALVREAVTTGSVDVHDVMIANAKAELAVNVTTQIATKVIQAYDKILQIQI